MMKLSEFKKGLVFGVVITSLCAGVLYLLSTDTSIKYTVDSEYTLSGEFISWDLFRYGDNEGEGYLLRLNNSTFNNDVSTTQIEHYFYDVGNYLFIHLQNFIGKNVIIEYHIKDGKSYIDNIKTL